MPKEDKTSLLFVLATIAYFAAHVAWALLGLWAVAFANRLTN